MGSKRKGLQTKLLASLDFSKTFDSVWHSALFHKLLGLAFHLALFAGPCPFFHTEEYRVFFRGASKPLIPNPTWCPSGLCLARPLHLICWWPCHAFLREPITQLYADDLAIWFSSLESCSHRPEAPWPPRRMFLEMAPPS